MRKQIRRLRLKKGDIIVVRDPQTMHELIAAAANGDFRDLSVNAPIVMAPEGIKRVSREYLLKILGLPKETA